jgi:hypothetical protein
LLSNKKKRKKKKTKSSTETIKIKNKMNPHLEHDFCACETTSEPLPKENVRDKKKAQENVS